MSKLSKIENGMRKDESVAPRLSTNQAKTNEAKTRQDELSMSKLSKIENGMRKDESVVEVPRVLAGPWT